MRGPNTVRYESKSSQFGVTQASSMPSPSSASRLAAEDEVSMRCIWTCRNRGSRNSRITALGIPTTAPSSPRQGIQTLKLLNENTGSAHNEPLMIRSREKTWLSFRGLLNRPPILCGPWPWIAGLIPSLTYGAYLLTEPAERSLDSGKLTALFPLALSGRAAAGQVCCRPVQDLRYHPSWMIGLAYHPPLPPLAG